MYASFYVFQKILFKYSLQSLVLINIFHSLLLPCGLTNFGEQAEIAINVMIRKILLNYEGYCYVLKS